MADGWVMMVGNELLVSVNEMIMMVNGMGSQPSMDLDGSAHSTGQYGKTYQSYHFFSGMPCRMILDSTFHTC